MNRPFRFLKCRTVESVYLTVADVFVQKRNIIFRNPNVAEGETEPTVIEKFE